MTLACLAIMHNTSNSQSQTFTAFQTWVQQVASVPDRSCSARPDDLAAGEAGGLQQYLQLGQYSDLVYRGVDRHRNMSACLMNIAYVVVFDPST